MKPESIEGLEKRVFRLSTGHGGWDLYLGLLLAAIGASALAEDLGRGDSSIWLAVIMAVTLAILYAVEQLIIRPRIGNVKFGARRKANLRLVSAIIGSALLVGLLVWVIYTASSHIFRWTTILPVLLWVVVSLSGFSLAAYLLGMPQLYLYGLLYAVGFASLELIQIPVTRALPVLVCGLLIIAMGIARFVRFLRKYPRVEQMP